MATSPARSAAVLLFALIAAAALVKNGHSVYWDPAEFQKQIHEKINEAREARLSPRGSVEMYPTIVMRYIEGLLQSLDGIANAMVFGNQIPVNCMELKTCHFTFRPELPQLEDATYTNGVPYKLAVFFSGFINKCDPKIEWGVQNWKFTHNDATKCFNAAMQPVTCETPGKCLVFWPSPFPTTIKFPPSPPPGGK